MFPSLTSGVITGGTFTHYGVTNQFQSSYERLREATAPNAFHNSGERRDPPKCHRNTRVAILKKILQWILASGRDSLSMDKQVMWMYGPAGAGKTAISQSISDACYDDQLLLASFFFSRFDNSRNHPRSLIPTIAYQVAESFPGETRKLIVDHIDRDPLIFTRSLQTQITSLVVNPLKPLIEAGYFKDPQKCRRLVMIDGLDECNDREGQLEILDAIQHAWLKHDVPLIFFIASRPEHDLKGAFQSQPLHGISTILPLDNERQSHRDIELFLRDKFAEIKSNHPFRSHIPPRWPSESIIQNLVSKSSGQFIYAATVIKYIKYTRHRPLDRLDVILGLRSSNRDMPFSELDALYTHILSSCEDPKPVLQILAFDILSPGAPQSMALGKMEAVFSLNPGDAEIILCDLGSVLQVKNQPDMRNRTIHFFHASLKDFLLDKSRSGEFWVNAPSRHEEFAHLYMAYLLKRSTSWPFDYTRELGNLGYHILKASRSPTLMGNIVSFSKSLSALRDMTRPNLPLWYQTIMNQQFDFFNAIKVSEFEEALRIYRAIPWDLAVYVRERKRVKLRAVTAQQLES